MPTDSLATGPDPLFPSAFPLRSRAFPPPPTPSRSYIRRQETRDRVIGTLLGSVDAAGRVTVKNSYAVPHNEQDGQVFVDVEFHRAMADLHRKVNPNEKVVGWYATGDGVVPTDALIHDFYAHECANPVHLTLDVAFKDPANLMRAWVGKSLVVGASKEAAAGDDAAEAAAAEPPTDASAANTKSPTGSRSNSEATKREAVPAGPASSATHFQEIPLEQSLADIERVGATRVIGAESEGSRDGEGLESTVRKLGDMLAKAAEYVAGVNEGKAPGDAEIGRRLADALGAVPRLTREQFEKVFGDAIQDVLLVMYLSNVTKMQLTLAEKLQTASLLI